MEIVAMIVAGIFITFYIFVAVMWLWFKFTSLSEEDESLMEKWNALYKCNDCGKYSRYYNMVQHKFEKMVYGGAKRADYTTCPNCDSQKIYFTKDDYGFLKSLPECMELDKKDFRKQQKTMDKLKEAVKEAEEINAFIEYHKLTRPPEQVEKSTFHFMHEDGKPTLIEIKFVDKSLNEKYIKDKDNWSRIVNILNEEENHAKRIQKMRTRARGM